MKLNTLICSLIFSACIDAISVPPAKNLMKSTSVDGAAANIDSLRIADTENVIYDFPKVPYENLPKILEPLMKDRSFEDAFKLSLNWNSENVNPLDRKKMNPLVLHNAELDHQYALRKWIKMPETQKKTDMLKKLLENPTIDFKKLDHFGQKYVLLQLWRSNDLDNFKILYDKLELNPQGSIPTNLAMDAVYIGDLEVYKFFLEKQVPVYPRDIEYFVASTGNVKFLDYIIKYRGPGDISVPDLYTQKFAAQSGNLDMIKYLIDDLDMSISYDDILIGAVDGKTDDVEKYFFDVLKYLHEEKNFPIPSDKSRYPKYMQDYFTDLAKKRSNSLTH